MTESVLTPTHDSGTAAAAISRTLAGAVIMVLALALAAQVRIPVPGTPVPFTLQSLALLVFALVLPQGAAVAGMAGYLALGSIGVPVFQPGSAGFAGPTGGYLVGFLVAVPVVGRIGKCRTAGLLQLHLAAATGLGLVLLCGTIWLSFWEGRWALGTGLRPFALKGMIEVSLAAWAVHALRGAKQRIRPRLAGSDQVAE